MNISVQIICFILGLVAPALATYPILRTFLGPRTSHPLIFLMSFPFGWGLLSLSLFLINLTGIKINLFSAGLVLISFYLISLVLKRISRKPPETVKIKTEPQLLSYFIIPLVVTAVLLWSAIGIRALAKPVDCMPGLGISGYKAMAIAKTGNVPMDILTDKDRPYLHQEYPLGYPILIAYGHLCLGGFDDHLIKLLPLLTGFLCFLMLIFIFSELGIPFPLGLLLSILISSGGTFAFCATTMYAELPMLLALMPGFFLLHRFLLERNRNDVLLGLLFLAMSAWIKNEGLVYFGLAVLYLLAESLISKRGLVNCRNILVFSILSAGIFILPWWITKQILGLELYDFSFSRPFNVGFPACLETFLLAWKRGLEYMFCKITANSGIWILISVAFIFQFRKKPESAGFFVWYFTFGTLFIFTSVFFFSVRPAEWHVNSLVRILMVSGILVMPYAIKSLLAPCKNL